MLALHRHRKLALRLGIQMSRTLLAGQWLLVNFFCSVMNA